MKFLTDYYFLLMDYSMFERFSINCYFSNKSFLYEPILRVLETPGLSVQIEIKKRNLLLNIGPFNMKDYI